MGRSRSFRPTLTSGSGSTPLPALRFRAPAITGVSSQLPATYPECGAAGVRPRADAAALFRARPLRKT
jgi:hypothetical protein